MDRSIRCVIKSVLLIIYLAIQILSSGSNSAPFSSDFAIDLDEALKPFKKCLIHITNFQGANIIPPQSPIILRQTKIIETKNPKRRGPPTIHLSVPIEVVNSSLPHFCPSLHLQKTSQTFCTQIELRHFLRNIRPWTCEAYISLYPDRTLFIDKPSFTRLDSSLFTYPYSMKDFNIVFQQMIPYAQRINILVLNKPAKNVDTFTMIDIRIWMQESISKWSLGMVELPFKFRDLFLFIEIFNGRNHMKMLTLKFGSGGLNRINEIRYAKVEKDDSDFSTLHKKLVLYSINDAMISRMGSLTKYMDNQETTTSIPFMSIICGTSSITSHLHRQFSASSQEKLVVYKQFFVSIWISILQNYSIWDGGKIYRCDRSESENLVYDVKLTVLTLKFEKTKGNWDYYPVLVRNPETAFRFVSCGQPLLEALAFMELFNVYDFYIWICISLLVLLFPSILFKMQEFGSQIRTSTQNRSTFQFYWFFQPVALILERGDPFLKIQLETATARWMVGSLLIAGIVISNAYKNDNVYKMIAPRKIIPYNDIQQLVTDGFEIFTRVTTFGNSQRFLSRFRDMISQISAHKIGIVGHPASNVFGIYSEFYKEVGKTKGDPDLYEIRLHNLTREQKLVASVKLHSKTIKIIKASGNPTDPSFSTTFLENQEKLLLKEIQKCNKVAVVLPEMACQRFLNEAKDAKNLNLGKNVIYEDKIGFYLLGWISDKLLGRLSALESSGIWNKEDDFIGIFLKKSSKLESNKVSAAKLSGNITVIFFTFLLGLLIGASSFILEIVFAFVKNVSSERRLFQVTKLTPIKMVTSRY
ncbi:unnamed protein product [Orchesella dallaii]|uniref:Uncharacterized protein n=1 Tax=Orchesella dallaii TaxID=48710 RepID=A0ABP1S9U3_9HEXA